MKKKDSPTAYQNPEGVRALGEWLEKESRRQNLTFSEVADASGGLVRHQALYNIRNCKTPVVEERTLAGIAAGLSVSINTVYDVYLLRQPVGEIKLEKREIELPSNTWLKLEEVARDCNLSLNQQITAMIYYHTTLQQIPHQANGKSPSLLPALKPGHGVNDETQHNKATSPSRAPSNRLRTRRKGS